jgi:hypothetical protein
MSSVNGCFGPQASITAADDLAAGAKGAVTEPTGP